MHILSVKLIDLQEIAIIYNGTFSKDKINQIQLIPQGTVHSFTTISNKIILQTSALDITDLPVLNIPGLGNFEISTSDYLDSLHSRKILGLTNENQNLIFRIFAPRAKNVKLFLYQNHKGDAAETKNMQKDTDGVWEYQLQNNDNFQFYTYSVQNPEEKTQVDIEIGDPYSKAVVTRNNYLHQAKSMIYPPENFDWEGDTWLSTKLEDLIIYEMHVRDMTQHMSSDISEKYRGKYLGLTEKNKRGGLSYIKSLGVNAVELLPIQEFANLEPDYKNLKCGTLNTWNQYAFNHWGYMTSYFMAPESYYATENHLDDDFCGKDGRAVNELKSLIKTLHSEGIAVILDIVFNHVSEFDYNPLKYIDSAYYLRSETSGQLCSKSGCGNDLKTERPMTRKLIVDTICHWMTEYHVDGFRFDLASLIDEDTYDAISTASRKINPNVILIAEPWGGDKYGQYPFSQRGWAAWNDWYRNGVKGAHPYHDAGFIFGKYLHNNSIETMKKYILGTTVKQDGPFIQSAHSVNYLESHDNYTLGDFIRLHFNAHDPYHPENSIKLDTKQMAIHKLAAMFLLISQGPPMIHAGQEFGRSKIIAQRNIPDIKVGEIDENSYNKDDETNWINYDHAIKNADLLNYYKGMIEIRKTYSCFRNSKSEEFEFIYSDHPFGLGYYLVTETHEFCVLLNGHLTDSAHFNIKSDHWKVIANRKTAGIDPLEMRKGPKITVPHTSGMILRRENSLSL